MRTVYKVAFTFTIMCPDLREVSTTRTRQFDDHLFSGGRRIFAHNIELLFYLLRMFVDFKVSKTDTSTELLDE